jgi:molybdate transport system substrate-binding protein
VRWWLVFPLLGLFAVACTGGDEAEGLTVFAAASLRDVVDELERAWLDEHPDVPLTVATEASNVLAAQIREGAPADVFMSADMLRPQQLTDAGLTAADPVPFAGNHISLVAALGAVDVQVPADLAQPGIRIVGVSEGVPITGYTHEVSSGLAATMTQPQVFAEAIAANVVSREDNVRAALAKVELGEGDAAFVYATDARGSSDVREVPLPRSADVTATYAVVQVSDHPAAADFVAWLGDPVATNVITDAGFEVAP